MPDCRFSTPGYRIQIDVRNILHKHAVRVPIVVCTSVSVFFVVHCWKHAVLSINLRAFRSVAILDKSAWVVSEALACSLLSPTVS